MFTLFKTLSYNLTLISSLFADGIQHGKLKVSDKAKDYYRVGVLKSGMHTAVLKEINSTCECLPNKVILEEFGAYFEVLRRYC